MSNKIGTRIVVRFRRARKHTGGTMIVRLWQHSLEIAVARGLPWEKYLSKVHCGFRRTLDGGSFYLDIWTGHLRLRYHHLTSTSRSLPER
jgi:hypothetical protein